MWNRLTNSTFVLILSKRFFNLSAPISIFALCQYYFFHVLQKEWKTKIHQNASLPGVYIRDRGPDDLAFLVSEICDGDRNRDSLILSRYLIRDWDRDEKLKIPGPGTGTESWEFRDSGPGLVLTIVNLCL